MKVGFDIHGVIDTYPAFFKKFAQILISRGQEVHILTGHQKDGALKELNELDFPYNHIFSIVDYHFSKGTEMKKTSSGWWMGHKDWVSTKGIYAKEVGLHIHFDDQLEYLTHFPETCKTMLVRDGFEDVMSLVIDMCTN